MGLRRLSFIPPTPKKNVQSFFLPLKEFQKIFVPPQKIKIVTECDKTRHQHFSKPICGGKNKTFNCYRFW